MSSLPAFIAIRTTFRANNCLGYNQQDGSLWYNQYHVVNPLTKFAVERSQRNRQWVHLRCCYSNKYWVKHSEDSDWINASADEPEEDTSLWSCTLFLFDDIGSHIHTITHVHSGGYLGHFGTARLTVYPGSALMARHRVRLIDWTKIVILPKHIAFKGDNGKYLGLVNRSTSPEQVLEFSKEDVADKSVHHEISYHINGTFNVITHHPNVAARVHPSPSWRMTSENDPITLGLGNYTPFMAIIASNNEIALHPQRSPRLFCRRFTQGNNKDLLYCNVSTMVEATRLQVVEPILSRVIGDVRYRFEHVKIHNVEPLILDSRPTVNNTALPALRNVGFRYEQKTETTWRGFVSLSLGVRMRFRAGIPIIASTTVTISGSFEGEYEWGETITETKTLHDNFIFIVPPYSTVTARMVATKGTCDLPFSYETLDTYYDGSTRRDEIDGGVYTGFNYFDLFRELVQEDGTVTIREPVGTVSLLKDMEPGAVSEPKVMEPGAANFAPKIMEAGVDNESY